MFHPPQKRLLFSLKIYIKDKILKEPVAIKYLWIIIDTNFIWNEHVNYINKKLKDLLASSRRLDIMLI